MRIIPYEWVAFEESVFSDELTNPYTNVLLLRGPYGFILCKRCSFAYIGILYNAEITIKFL